MPIFLTDTVAPDNSTFKIADGKDIGGALTGSALSSSGEIVGTNISVTGYITASATGSFGYVSSSGAIFANLVDNSAGTLKTVIFDNTTGQFFTTTSTAAGVPSLEAISEVSPFQITQSTVLTASSFDPTLTTGIVVNRLYNGSGKGWILFNTSSATTQSQFMVGSTANEDSDSGMVGGLRFAGGNATKNGASIDAIGVGVGNDGEEGLTIKHNGNAILRINDEALIYPVYVTGSNPSGMGNFRAHKLRGEAFFGSNFIIKTADAGGGSLEETPHRTRFQQIGGTGGTQMIVASGSGMVIQPTSSLPGDVYEGALVYKDGYFYIAVP